MKILIIGSEGFIGSNLLVSLKQDYIVFSADIFYSSVSEKHFILNTSLPDFDSIFQKDKFDYCINASGSGSVSNSFKEIENDFNLNTTNVFKILNAIKLHNPECKFINFSSAAVYGNPEILPVKETSLIKPVSPYGFHKYYSEQISKEFYTLYNIKSCNLRVFSAYGPRLKKQLFWDIYQKGKTSDTIELLGNGNESRDFIYIDDIISAIEKIINSDCFHADVINVASGIETKISVAAHLFVKEMFGNKNIVFSNITNEGYPDNWLADINKIESIGFTPKTSMEEGLIQYANWLKKNFQ
jgi:dTDP-glucose 4,6-dehydratase/UDP-glucose 4-epimerase